MKVIINYTTVNQKVISWDEAVAQFNLSKEAMYPSEFTLKCGTKIKFM